MEPELKSEYKVWWDDENKLGMIYVIGEVDEGMITKIIEEGNSITDRYGKQIGWIIDLTNLTKPLVSIRTRKIMTDAVKLVSRGSIAIVGMSALIKVVLGFVLKATRQKDIKMRFFSNKEDAIKWLKE